MSRTVERTDRDGLIQAKRSFYRVPEVAAEYDRRRFGGASGGYVNERETRLASELLPSQASIIADVAAGTGRLFPLLASRAQMLVAFDTSLPMLQQAARRGSGRLVQADAFSLPLLGGACDAVVSLRLLFHFDDPRPLLRELRRITRPGGVLVCDTASWSPRQWLPLDRSHWGERVTTVSPEQFRDDAKAAGWEVLAARPCFLLSPYVYRRLPLALARRLERLEHSLPDRLLCRVFWGLRAAD